MPMRLTSPATLERGGRYTLACVLSLGMAAGLYPSAPQSGFEAELEAVAAAIDNGLADGGIATVAVVDFTDLSGQATELGRFLAEELSVALVHVAGAHPTTAGKRRVIDRTHLKALLVEHKLSASGLIEPATARQVGRISGVQALVTGTLTPFAESVRVTVKTLDTESAHVLTALAFHVSRTTTINELLAATAPTAALVTASPSSVRLGASPTPRPARPLTPVTQRVGGFVITLEGCTREGRSATCSGTVTNKNTTGAPFALVTGRNWGTYAVDDRGNQDSGEQRITIGSGGTEITLEPDIVVRFSATFGGFSTESSSLTVVLAVPGYVLGRDFGPRSYEKLTFRHMALDEPR